MPQIMVLYITNISALFAMTVHHKTLQEDRNIHLHGVRKPSLLCCLFQHLMQEAVSEVFSPTSDSRIYKFSVDVKE